MVRMITNVVVDIAVDTDTGVIRRKLSCSLGTGDEDLDQFFNRIYATLEQLVGREPIETSTWRVFAQELLSSFQAFAIDAGGCVSGDLEHRAREMGLDTEAWVHK